jgi:diadenosine tetraphosphate (Ap4A) HIT family hydrolase
MGEIVLTPENIEDIKELFDMPSDEIDAYFTALRRITHDD